MQTQERNSLADSLNSIKIDLKLIALGGKKMPSIPIAVRGRIAEKQFKQARRSSNSADRK